MVRSPYSYSAFVVLFLTSLTLLSGFILSSSTASADDDTAVDEINITVPVSCNLTGVGMDSHTTSLMNGNYASNVGTTTLKASCNDNEGFAIYAIGYTDDTDGKTVMTSSALGSEYDIQTGTGTSGNSQWAMKLATQTSPEPAYPISIENNYNNYHTVPDDYELVAKRTAATDIGTNAIGSVLTSTYQIYVSTTQPAGTYIGKVKYVLVHPNYVDSDAFKDAVTVTFDGNGLTFPGGATTNTVKYAEVCRPGEYMYVGNTPAGIMKTSNLSNDGTQNGAYSRQTTTQTFQIDGADAVKVVVDYGISDTENNWVSIVEGDWGGNTQPEGNYNIIYSDFNKQGQESFVYEGDTVSIQINTAGTPITGYDYGFYVKLYPAYLTEHPNTTGEEMPSSDCFIIPIQGDYTETSPWKDKWTAEVPNQECYWDDELQENVCVPGVEIRDFLNYDEISNYVINNYDLLKGMTINLVAYNPYTIYYDGNGSTFGSMEGFKSEFEDSSEQVVLLAPNYAKIGYGFAGWSNNPSTVVNGNGVIYGPNETITGSDLLYDNNNSSTLYAVWVQSSGNMQNYSCSTLANGQVTALTDSRDGNVYTVGKMQDGNCWMMENLRLDNTSLLTTDNTNINSVVFNYLPSSSDEWCGGLNETCINQPKLNTNNTKIGGVNSHGDSLIPIPITTERAKNLQWYSYGNYYNYHTATAGTGNYSTHDAVADGDICPKGWFLPSGNGGSYNPDNGSFSYLDKRIGGDGSTQYTAEASNRWRKYPINLTLSGHYYGSVDIESGATDLGYQGQYKTGLAGHNNMSSIMEIELDTVILNLYSYKYSGSSIRCITR